jgi:hypothetical protein
VSAGTHGISLLHASFARRAPLGAWDWPGQRHQLSLAIPLLRLAQGRPARSVGGTAEPRISKE